MLKPNDVIAAASIAAECLQIITVKCQPGSFRAPDQISLIVDLINTAVDSMFEGEETEELCKAKEVEIEPKIIHCANPEEFNAAMERIVKELGGKADGR